MLLLALVGVASADIAEDYEVSARWLPPLDVDKLLASRRGVNPRSPRQLEDDLAIERRRREQAPDRDARSPRLRLDGAAHLRAAGLEDGHVAALRARMLGSRSGLDGQHVLQRALTIWAVRGQGGVQDRLGGDLRSPLTPAR